MAETLTLTTPHPPLTTWRVFELHLNWQAAIIQIGLIGTNGEQLHHAYTGATATTLMQQLNVVNLSVKSLQRRVIERLMADGVVAGTVAGAPD